AGPATNVATITSMCKFLGGRAMFLYRLTIAVSAVAGGLTLDWLFTTLDVGVPIATDHAQHTAMGVWLSSAWAVILLAILAFSYLVKSHDDEWHNQ
ncbi:MAG: hypothetical protein K8R46_11645, partial [Pirellulales bacterium]|nr:hypothetical protein [Pirellulales bacterium]